MAVRGGDDTLKLWDVRSFKKPVNVANNLFSRFEYTECSFSPNDQVWAVDSIFFSLFKSTIERLESVQSVLLNSFQ